GLIRSVRAAPGEDGSPLDHHSRRSLPRPSVMNGPLMTEMTGSTHSALSNRLGTLWVVCLQREPRMCVAPSRASSTIRHVLTQRAMEQTILGETLPHGRVNAFVNPPVAALLLRPLAGLTPRTALMVFALISLAALFGGGVWLLRSMTVSSDSGCTDWALIIVS